MLDHMKRNNPKQFYKVFRKKSKFNKTNLTVHDFFPGIFSNLMSGENEDSQYSQDTRETICVFNELHENFSDDEMCEQIHKLKKNKVPGTDGLLSEMFLKCENVFLSVFKKILTISYQPVYIQQIVVKESLFQYLKL